LFSGKHPNSYKKEKRKDVMNKLRSFKFTKEGEKIKDLDKAILTERIEKLVSALQKSRKYYTLQKGLYTKKF